MTRQKAHPRVGIIGTGFMGTVHSRAVRAAGGTVTRVVGRNPAGAIEAAARLGALATAESADALIECDDVDVVHICTPNSMHARLAKKTIAAGKAVVCEKPLATTLRDAIELAEFAKHAGVVAAVPFVYRFYPAVREIKARLESGEAGPLWLLHGSYLQDWLADSQTTNWRVDPQLGGDSRAFGDIGVHWCDIMEFTTGHRITRLVAKTSRAFRERRNGEGKTFVGTEDGAVLLFETDRGATGSLVVSQVTPGRKNRLWFSFDGTKESLSFNQENPNTLWIGDNRSGRRVPSGAETLDSAQGRKYATLPPGHPQGYQDSFNAFVADVYAAIDGGTPEGLPTFADGLRAAQITDAVLQSAAEQAWVEVPGGSATRASDRGGDQSEFERQG